MKALDHRLADVPGRFPDVVARRTLNHSAQPYVVMDASGTITFAGASVEDVFGWHPDQLIGRNIVEFIRDDQTEAALQAVDELQADSSNAIGVPMVFALKRPDGRPVWVEVGAHLHPEEPEWISLRLRPWDSEHHFDRFVASLLRTEPLEVICHELCASIAAGARADGAVIHHQCDGRKFTRAEGIGVPPACYLTSDGPWMDLARRGEITHLEVGTLPDLAASAAVEAGFGSVWVQPIDPGPGLPLALLSVWRRESTPPHIGHRKVLERSSQYVQLALTHRVEYDRLIHVSGHDSLTGVANRTRFQEQLRMALLHEENLAVAFCDLDEFKAVNDTYGHRAGDHVLTEVADRLRRSLRSGDELARIGGDEFTAILHQVPDTATAEELARRMAESLAEPFRIGDQEARVGLSVGVVMAGLGTDPDWVLAVADEALYEAKRAGGGVARVVDASDPAHLPDPPGRLGRHL